MNRIHDIETDTHGIDSISIDLEQIVYIAYLPNQTKAEIHTNGSSTIFLDSHDVMHIEQLWLEYHNAHNAEMFRK